jgi:phosphatidylglycerophosphate synthase
MSDTSHLSQSKHDQSYLGKYEKAMLDFLLPLVPSWLQTYHLTLMTIVRSALAVLSGYLANLTENNHWLWLLFVVIILQYFSDLLDGSVGRSRNTGLVLWWFYMDHLLDYIFLISSFVAWAYVIPDDLLKDFFVLVIIANVLFFQVFVSIPVTQAFTVSFSKIGPTEYRMFGCLAILGLIYIPEILYYALPTLILILFIVLIFMIYSTQKKLWKKDMENKKN